MLLKKSGFEKVRACRLVDFFNGIGKCCNIILDLGCVKYILPVRIHLAPASSQRCSRFSGKIGKMPSTAVRSSTPPSKPSASAAACACSCCRRARPSSTARSSALSARIPRSSTNCAPATALRLRVSTARPAPGSASTTPSARIRRSAISLRSSSCVAHAAKLRLGGLTALCARVRRGQGSTPETSEASLPLTPAHRARHNPSNPKSVTYVPNEYKALTIISTRQDNRVPGGCPAETIAVLKKAMRLDPNLRQFFLLTV